MTAAEEKLNGLCEDFMIKKKIIIALVTVDGGKLLLS